MKQGRVPVKEAGHRRLGSINNVDDIPASPGRLEGFRAHLIEEGVAADDVAVVAAQTDLVGGYVAAKGTPHPQATAHASPIDVPPATP